MTFEYEIPRDETIVKRQFAHSLLEHDTFTISVAGDVLATVDYERARSFWLGKIELAELVSNDGK